MQSLINKATADGTTVIDLKLDAVGMESITRTWVGTKKVSFDVSVLAHYTLLTLTNKDASIALTLKKADMVNIYYKVPDEKNFGGSVTPIGTLNGNNSSTPQPAPPPKTNR